MQNDFLSVADVEGAWSETAWDSSLMERLREAWNKPLFKLTNYELATFLEQNIATAQILPIAEKRFAGKLDDGSELFDGHLEKSISHAKRGRNTP